MEREEYKHLFELEDKLWWFVGMRKITESLLERYLPPKPPEEVRLILDAGCGTGGMLPHLRKFGKTFGIDFSADAVRFVRSRNERSIARSSIVRLPFPPATFDLVTEFEVVNHWAVPDDRAAFEELSRVLRPGGILLLREPAYQWLFAKHDLAVHTRHRYSRREIEDLLKGAGFEPLHLGYANFFLFPVALVRRLVGNVLPADQGSDVREMPGPLNAVLESFLRLEAHWVKRGRLPFGLSLLAVAKKR